MIFIISIVSLLFSQIIIYNQSFLLTPKSNFSQEPLSLISSVKAGEPREEVLRANFNSLPKANNKPKKEEKEEISFNLTAPRVLVLDLHKQKALFQKSANQKTPIASLTKLMTALIFLENNPGWNKTITVIAQDQKEGGPSYLVPGERITIKDLFYTSLVGSSNTAAMVLVRSTGLSIEEFVKLMNKKAEELGLVETFFIDPTGLDKRNVSTASEVSLLAETAFKNKEIKKAVLTRKYSFEDLDKKRWREVINTNNILSSGYLEGYNVLGGKTGFIEEAGYNLILEAEKEDKRVMAVVLGSQNHYSRFTEIRDLIKWALK